MKDECMQVSLEPMYNPMYNRTRQPGAGGHILGLDEVKQSRQQIVTDQQLVGKTDPYGDAKGRER